MNEVAGSRHRPFATRALWSLVNKPLSVAIITSLMASVVGSLFVDRAAQLEARFQRRTQMLPVLAELEFRWNKLNALFSGRSSQMPAEEQLERARVILQGADLKAVSDPRFRNVHAGTLVSRLDGLGGTFARPPLEPRLSSALLWIDDAGFTDMRTWRFYVHILGRFVRNRTLAIQGDVVPVEPGTEPNCELFTFLNLDIQRDPIFNADGAMKEQLEKDCLSTINQVKAGRMAPRAS